MRKVEVLGLPCLWYSSSANAHGASRSSSAAGAEAGAVSRPLLRVDLPLSGGRELDASELAEAAVIGKLNVAKYIR